MRLLPWTAWLLLMVMVPMAARSYPPLVPLLPTVPAGITAYSFLGDLLEFEPNERGAIFRCEPGARLDVTFVGPGVVRVTLIRRDREERLLEDPLVGTDPGPVAVAVAEDSERIVLRSEDLQVVVDRSPCRIKFRDSSGNVLSRDDPGFGIGWDGNEVRNWKEIAEGERFFGLGEKTGDVDKRGREWVMWNRDTPGYGNESDPLYQSIPFFVGLRDGRAFGIYLNNSYRTVFNMGAGNHRYYSFAAADGPLDYFFFHGPEITRVVERFTALVGRTPMPPLWSLGYQQSRWSYHPDERVLELAETFREKQMPADVIYLDIHYMDDYRIFTWHPERFPDPEGLLRRLESMGFKVVVIVDPGVKEDPDYVVAQEGLAGDRFVRYPDGEIYVGSVWPGRSYFPDFSRPETRAWWGGYLARLLDQGVDGIWNDMNEPAVWGRELPVEVETEAGSMKRVHNLYGFHMAQGTYEALVRHRPDRRPFVLTRAGFAGIQRYAAVWTGDNVATWEHMELGIRMLIGLGLSGVPFVGTDIGGFEGGPSPELFARWMQLGAFSPLYRAHTASGTPPQEPWAFGDEVEAVSRQALELRYRLLPYFYALFHEAQTTGAPILRPLFWHHQADSAAYDRRWQHQFLVGERLLVAPVTREDARQWEVYLPEGRWLDLATGTVHDGGQEEVVDAPLDRIPMFLGEGGILPMGEPMQHVGDQAAEWPSLTMDVFPGADPGSFELYEDDGASLEHRDGAYRLTRYTVRRAEDGIELVREVAHDGRPEIGRSLAARFYDLTAAPTSVTVDGVALAASETGPEGFAYDAERRVLTVRLRETRERQSVTIR